MIDPLGLESYIVYREFNDPHLSKAYNDAGALGIGHFYLVFDDKNIDSNNWSQHVNKLGGQSKKNLPYRQSNPSHETFSFHPKKVLDEELGITSKSGGDIGTFYTTSSYIGYNDTADIKPFLKHKYPGIHNDAAEAKVFPLKTTAKQQYELYEHAINMRKSINEDDEDVFGKYKLTTNNCGTWAVTITDRLKIDIPNEIRLLNMLGTGVGGPQDYLPFGKSISGYATVVGTIKGVANTVKDDINTFNRKLSRGYYKMTHTNYYYEDMQDDY